MKRVLRSPFGVGAGFGLALAAAALAIPAAASSPPVVTTSRGPIQGMVVNGVAEFLGIPYAAPPIGNLRWAPPVDHARWTSVLQTTNYGPICAQHAGEPFSGPTNTNEDCLYLNIFSADLHPKSGDKLPVMFFIYGGGDQEGESNGYDGSVLASQGHTVVVTINYRLNTFGFLTHPALAVGGLFSNYGLLDQQFGLRWVRQNIARFGGDPNNVTIFGESGGSHDVNAHLLSPLSSGLFERGIQESGAPVVLVPLQVAEAAGKAFATAVGCGSGSNAAIAKCLRALPASTIQAHPLGINNLTPLVGDGKILPPVAETAFQTGDFNHVPVMNGSNEDEFNWDIGVIEYNENPREPYSEAQFTSFITSTFSGNAGPAGQPPAYPPGTVAKVLAKYPLSNYPTPEYQGDAAGTDGAFAVGACKTRHFTRTIAGQVPVYEYEFRDRSAVTYFPPMPGYVPLAYHTAELVYLFPGWHGDQGIPTVLTGKQKVLSDQLIAAWTNFAWYGNPNGTGNAPWPPYTLKNPVIFGFDVTPAGLKAIPDETFAAQHKCDFWDQILVYKPQ
ncbi:MAG TPA: carboxylesterase family protein [Methylovirgula sp.]|nr:carboxylesterase family protein [Methylovirgula sp.]